MSEVFGEFYNPQGLCRTCRRYWTYQCGDLVYSCTAFGTDAPLGNTTTQQNYWEQVTLEHMGAALRKSMDEVERYRRPFYKLKDVSAHLAEAKDLIDKATK